MKHFPHVIIILSVIAIQLCTGCANRNTKISSVGLIPDSVNLVYEENATAGWFYHNPDVDWAKYDKILVDELQFFLSKEADYRGLDANEMQIIADYYAESVLQKIGDTYTFVNQPGPSTLRIRSGLTHIKPGDPVLGPLTTIDPIGLGLSAMKKAMTGTHIGMAEAGFEAVILDSSTGDVLIAILCRSVGDKSNLDASTVKWAQVKVIFDEWTQNFGDLLLEKK